MLSVILSISNIIYIIFYPWAYKFWGMVPTLPTLTARTQHKYFIFKGMFIIFYIIFYIILLKLQVLKNTEDPLQ